MALQSFTVSIGALRDVNNNDKNYVSGEAIYVKTIGGSFAPIFRDLAGTSEIAQDGLANQTNIEGQFTFFVEAGDYILDYQNQSTPVTIVGPDYFNNRVEETVNQIIIDTATSRGFRVVGDFASGFTYELPNDVAVDANGNYWAYADINALPVTVSAGTTPSEPNYTQVTFNQASGVTTTAGINAQQFIDNFELKIFQSTTDNLTKVTTFAGGVGIVYEVRKTSDNSLATIYSDKDGATSIPQNGTANVSNGDAEAVFYIADGDYTVTINATPYSMSVGGGRCVASDINLGLYAVGRRLTVDDRGGAIFEVVNGGTPNGYDILNAGGGNTAVLQYSDLIDAEWFGANELDSTNALNRAAELCDGHSFTFGGTSRKLATDTIKFAGSVEIVGGKLKNSPASGNANKPAVWLQGDNSSIGCSGLVDIEGEDIAGTYPQLAFSNSGLRVSKETPDFTNNRVNGLVIGDNLKINGMRGEGILLSHIGDFSIGSPEIKKCAYAGILGKSCVDGSVNSPKISTIVREGGVKGDNAYGITFTRDTTTDLVNDPPSTNIKLVFPIVKDVPTWIGIDTHAGVNITMLDSRVYQCWKPYNIQYDSADPLYQNSPKNVKFAGYGSSFAGENDSDTGVTVLGVAGAPAEDIELDLVLKNCGSTSSSQKGAITLTETRGVKGKVRLVESHRVGLVTVGNNEDVDLKVDQQGVVWSAGTTFYAYLQPPTLADFKISGDWKAQAGKADQADTGIFYTAAQGSQFDTLIDVKMDVPSGNYTDNGTTKNLYHELSWNLEEQRKFSRVILAGGSPSENFNVDFPRKFRGSWNSVTVRNDVTTMITIDSTAHPMLTAEVGGLLDTDTVVVKLKTLDGSNIQPGGFAVSFTSSVSGISFSN